VVTCSNQPGFRITHSDYSRYLTNGRPFPKLTWWGVEARIARIMVVNNNVSVRVKPVRSTLNPGNLLAVLDGLRKVICVVCVTAGTAAPITIGHCATIASFA